MALITMKANTREKRILVAAHDAGVAEVLSSYIYRNNINARYILGGPAKEIFYRKLGIRGVETENMMNELVLSDLLLSSTSWQSDLEYNALRMASTLGKKSVAFLDHWVNYSERFIRSGVRTAPSQIWCGDRYALTYAKKVFQDIPVYYEENAYFLDVKEQIRELSNTSISAGVRCLYLCEPITDYWTRKHGSTHGLSYNENDAINYFLDNLVRVDERIDEVILRLHPSEPHNKYDNYLCHRQARVRIAPPRPLIEDIVECTYIVGCNTMAMVIGVLAGKKVLSVIPPGEEKCVLPFGEIRMLRSIVQDDHNTRGNT
jgi:hypothetical protein